MWPLLQNEWLFSARQAQVPVQEADLCAIALTDKPTVQIQLTDPVGSSSVPWLRTYSHQAHSCPHSAHLHSPIHSTSSSLLLRWDVKLLLYVVSTPTKPPPGIPWVWPRPQSLHHSISNTSEITTAAIRYCPKGLPCLRKGPGHQLTQERGRKPPQAKGISSSITQLHGSPSMRKAPCCSIWCLKRKDTPHCEVSTGLH